jgi:hypothetical protein
MEKKTVITITITEDGFMDSIEANGGGSNYTVIIGVIEIIKNRLLQEEANRQKKMRKNKTPNP